MQIFVLGSAAGGGVPQWNCVCAGCRTAWAGLPATRRTQASIAISDDGQHWVLINASPDITTQILSNPAFYPREAVRHSPITTVIITGGEVDQIGGLLSLRESQPLAVLGPPDAMAILDGNPIFNVLASPIVERRCVEAGTPFWPLKTISMSLFAVPGKLPLFLESKDAPTSEADSYGIEIRSAAATVCYVPAAAHVTQSMRQRFESADVLFFDGTCFHDRDLIDAGIGNKTSRRMGHIPIGDRDGSLELLDGVRARRIYIHINNTNPILIERSPQRRCVEQAGWEIAFDGMSLRLV